MARVSQGPVNTCSIAFDDPAFDESRFAQMVAERYHTRHSVDRVESDDFDLIDELARVYDEPYADSSAIPTYRVCQLARTPRHRGAVRRRRRRELRRLPPLPAAPGRGALPPRAAARRARAAVRRARARSTRRRTGRRACPARQVDVRGAGAATRSRPISTACRSCATTCARQLFSAPLPPRARRLQRDRGVPRATPRDARHRRSARAGPVPRPQDLSASATSTPRSTAPAWRTRSRCASR